MLKGTLPHPSTLKIKTVSFSTFSVLLPDIFPYSSCASASQLPFVNLNSIVSPHYKIKYFEKVESLILSSETLSGFQLPSSGLLPAIKTFSVSGSDEITITSILL